MRSSWLVLAAILMMAILGACQSGASGPSSNTRLDEGVNAYFNDPLAGLPHMRDLEAQAGGLDRALIELIKSAERSLGVALYHLRTPELIQAIQDACRRGVLVRLVLESDDADPDRVPGCVDLALDRNDRLMHHKFAVVDDARVWSGSFNWTDTGLYFDANNAVLVRSREVADAYGAELDEMHGARRFGSAKRDTNGERFEVSGIPLEVHFGPSDDPRRRLVELIDGAEHSIALAMNVLTDNPIYESLEKALARGVTIESLWDFQSWEMCQFSEADELLERGIGIWDANPGLLHHKYAVIDGKTVVTGSANWSRSGMERNDENLVVIGDRGIAQEYLKDFQKLQRDAENYERSPAAAPRVEVRHFAVARNAAIVLWRPHALNLVEHYEICRTSQPHARGCERVIKRPGWAWYAVDREVTPGETYIYRVRSWDGQRWSDLSNPYRAEVPKGIPRLTPAEAAQWLERYRSHVVTVRFTVTNDPKPRGQGGNLFLNAGQDYETDFTAFIPGCSLERFTGSGLDLFGLRGRTIEVTGKLDEFNGPEIVVTAPWQIRVLEP